LGVAYTPAEGGVSLIVAPDGPSAKAKLKTGDVVTAVNGAPVRRMLDFGRRCWGLPPDRSVEFTLQDGRTVSVTPAPIAVADLLSWRLGLQVQKLTANLNRVLDLPESLRGLAISEVLPEPEFKRQQTPWRELLKRGDLILAVGDAPVTSPAAFAEMLRTRRAGESLTLTAAILDERVGRFLKTKLEVILK
ncbi:MAG: PDZ domain-containing protein, partial [Victivallales bacterium]|nr:PDZ domain-containing protein [Victivallales bacterium]